MKRRRHRSELAALGALLAALAAGGCGAVGSPSATGEPATDEVYEAAGKPTSPFTAPDELLEEIRTFRTAGDALRLLDLAFPLERAEKEAIARFRERELARIDFDLALRQQFPEQTSGPPDDLGIGEIATALQDATIDRREGRRAYAGYRTGDGEEGELVFVRFRDSWWVAPETFSGGERIDDQWYFQRQVPLLNTPGIYAEVTQQVHAGRFASPQEARAALRAALRADVPATGILHGVWTPRRTTGRGRR